MFKYRKKRGITEDDLRNMYYERNPAVHYLIKNGLVTIIKKNNHPIQKFFRNKLHFNIPEESTLDLDTYGSFVFINLDGQTSVYDLGKKLGEKYQGARELQYTRLVFYLQQLDQQNNLIIKLENK